jgi:hypothetical protein
MSATINAREPKPWYRYRWPWLLMLPPLASVCGGVTMIWLATSTPASLVVEDYARIETITAARFEADARAASHGVTARARLDRVSAEDVLVSISLDAPASPTGDQLLLRFRHATDASHDAQVLATRTATEYAARASLPEGTYLLEIEPTDASWRLAARLQPSTRQIELTATESNALEVLQ